MEARCGCKNHNEFSAGGDTKIYKLSGKKFRVNVVEELRKQGFLGPRCNYLCVGCYSYAVKNFDTDLPTSSSKRQRVLPPDVARVIQQIEDGTIEDEALAALARAIGQSQHAKIVRDAESLSVDQTYQNIEQFNIKAWLNARNVVVRSFMQGVANLEDFSATGKKLFALVASLDCLYSTCFVNLITPLEFGLQLLSYVRGGNKGNCKLNAKLLPCGSYTTVQRWLEGQSQAPNVCPSGHDIVSFFDNNQKLARNWRVRYDAKAVVSVMTNIIHISPSIQTTLQAVPELSPSSWLYQTSLTNKDIVNLIFTLTKEADNLFNVLRNDFVTKRLEMVYQEQISGNRLGADVVDKVCADHKTNIGAGATDVDEYSFMEHGHAKDSPKVTVGEPCFVNPCSYNSIRTVIEHILEASKVGEERQWTIIGADGLPFLLASRLLQKEPQLQNVLLQPGLGHYEINMVKASFKLLWEVCLSDLAKMLGYNSIKAQMACKNAGDHHKAWQLLKIFFNGTCDELLRPFVRSCIASGQTVSVRGYRQWCSEVKNPNYIFLKDVIFTYMLSLFLFRAGVRRNNADCILSSRVKFSSLFYGLHMIHYQEIDFIDLKTRVLAPPQLHDFQKANEAFSISGHPSKGEGGDFVLEGKNRRCKMWIPPGIPTEARWLRVCRNLDRLDKISITLQEILNTTSPQRKCGEKVLYHPDLRNETIRWRAKLRSCGYLAEPKTCRPHTSSTGLPLDNELSSFAAFCKGNREIFLEDIAAGKELGKTPLIPIFVTPADSTKFHSITSKTKPQIEHLIQQGLSTIQEAGFIDVADRLRHMWNKDIKTQTKDVYIAFYRELYNEMKEVEDIDNDISLSDDEADGEETDQD